MFQDPQHWHYPTHFSVIIIFILLTALKNGRRTLRPFASIAVKRSQGTSSQIQMNPEKDTKLTIPATHTSSSEHEQEDHKYEENIKKNILENSLQFVPKTGWSVESLSAGAKAAGYPTITHGLFPNGGGDLVHYFNVRCNEQLVDAMKTVSRCKNIFKFLKYLFAFTYYFVFYSGQRQICKKKYQPNSSKTPFIKDY